MPSPAPTSHAGPRLLITGIPTAGKSRLGGKLAEATGGILVSVDRIRDGLSEDARYRKWVRLYLDLDERGYYEKWTPEERWESLERQTEGLWPGILAEMRRYEDEKRPVIFEGVNLLPSLAARDLGMPGLALLGRSFEETLERNERAPRWGASKDLQRMEAEEFFNEQRPRYRAEAAACGWPSFETAEDAWDEAVRILGQAL